LLAPDVDMGNRHGVVAVGELARYVRAMALTGVDSLYEALDRVLQAVHSKKGDVGMRLALDAKRLRYGGFTMADV
jgi:hypothetical protein